MGEGVPLFVSSILERVRLSGERTDRSKYFRGEIDKYSWVDIGSSYLPSEICSALLWVQLEHLDDIQEKRSHIWDAYYVGLKPFEEKRAIRLPIIPDYVEHNAHLFYILFHNEVTRNCVMNHLKKMDIDAVFLCALVYLIFPKVNKFFFLNGRFVWRLLRLPIIC